MSIIAELPGFLQVFSDFSVRRFPAPTTTASPDFSGGYKSKDIVIDAAKPITGRIFIPDTKDQLHPFPVLVHYHGGGFSIGSTAWTGIHNYLGGLCVKAQVLIVSVDYRLAPENRIPAAYDDCYGTLQWLASNAGVEPWLERADLSRVFLSGESAGGNIVHHVMLRVVRDKMDSINVNGLVIIHPFFGSEERIESELADEAKGWVTMSDITWRLSLPEGADRDHWACNFANGEVPIDAVDWQQFPAVVVHVAGLDELKERGIMYAEFLKGKGVEVDVVLAEGQAHCHHVFNPDFQATLLVQSQIAEFMKQH